MHIEFIRNLHIYKKLLRQNLNTFRNVKYSKRKMCSRKLSRVPWTVRRSNQSILKEMNPEYSLEVLMLKLQYSATWCEELALWKRPSCLERLWQEEKGTTEDKMVGWHPWLNWLEFKWTQWDGERQGSLACCSLWGFKELDTT